MCIPASVFENGVHHFFDLDEDLRTCFNFGNGLGRRCVYLRRFWVQMCIIVSVLHEDVHNCLGFA